MGILIPAAEAPAHDWTHWRGPYQNGFAPEKLPVSSWSPDGENLVWKSPEGGRTTPIVMNGRVYFNGPVGSGECLEERVICLDAENGKTLWEHPFSVFLTDIVENRVGWNALVADAETERVYCHGTGGEMICLDREGKVIWKRSLTEEFGRISGYGGRLHTPIIDEDRVIISFLASGWGAHAKPSHRFVALDKRTGEVVWWAEIKEAPEDTTYACPVVTVAGGVRQLVAAAADGDVYGFEARTGKHLWQFKLSKGALNSSPVAEGDRVFVFHGEENPDTTTMGRVVCIDATQRGEITKSGEIWRQDGAPVSYVSPALANGRLYAVTNGADIRVYDAKTGKPEWEFNIGRVGKGSPIVTADGAILVGEQNGIFWLLKDAGDHCEVLNKYEFAPRNGFLDEIYGSPALVNGRVYLITRYGTYCFGKKAADPATEAKPMLAAEKEPNPEKPAALVIQPAELTLAPGGQAQLTLMVIDENGRVVKGMGESDADVQAVVKGVNAKVGSRGLLTAGPEQRYSAGTVDVTWKGLAAATRIRVMPDLPIKDDFESYAPGSAPPGWVGVSKKMEIVELEGHKTLKKLAENPSPPFMRIRAYATPVIVGNCTVQADMMSNAKGDRFLADMGLINSRYRLFLSGIKKTLRLDSWDSVPRFQKDETFILEPEKWYTMKFEIEYQADGKAALRGKVWPRGEEEPTAWTIEYVDACPNDEGSAGLYGFSPGTTSKSKGPEIFYDNFAVSRP